MPKKNSLVNDREIAICARLREFREHIKWSQAAFASEVGISRDKLASIESGRTPVRYELAARIAERFKLSEVWLAGKRFKPNSVIPFDDHVKQSIPMGALLSVAFEQVLWPAIGDKQRKAIEFFGPTGLRLSFPPAGQPPDKRFEWPLLEEVRAAIKSVPKEHHHDFAQAVLEGIDRFCQERGLRCNSAGRLRTKDRKVVMPDPFDASIWTPEKPVGAAASRVTGQARKSPQSAISKDILDSERHGDNVAGMSREVPTWLQLKKAIARRTSDRGAKAALAKELGVSRQVFGNWLSDDDQGAPNAELTLRLLKWVNDPKRQTE